MTNYKLCLFEVGVLSRDFNVKTPNETTLDFMSVPEEVSITNDLQGGSNMTGTICVLTSHSLSLSYLNHLVSSDDYST
jgi:hypothetical protein